MTGRDACRLLPMRGEQLHRRATQTAWRMAWTMCSQLLGAMRAFLKPMQVHNLTIAMNAQYFENCKRYKQLYYSVNRQLLSGVLPSCAWRCSVRIRFLSPASRHVQVNACIIRAGLSVFNDMQCRRPVRAALADAAAAGAATRARSHLQPDARLPGAAAAWLCQ